MASGQAEEVMNAAESVGNALARISEHTFSKPGFLDANLDVPQPWTSVYDGFFPYLVHLVERAQMDEGLKRRVVGAWTSREERLRIVTEQPCLSHADYKASNLLIHGGRLSGVLDWEFVHAGTWLLDAGQVLRYLGPLRETFADEMERGFQKQMPPDWRELSRTIDLINLTEFLVKPSGEQQAATSRALIMDSVSELDSD
jgi:Ser/Thr protein kinase RdoA (MazF antagonist)